MKHENQELDDRVTGDTIALLSKPLIMLFLSVGAVDCGKETR